MYTLKFVTFQNKIENSIRIGVMKEERIINLQPLFKELFNKDSFPTTMLELINEYENLKDELYHVEKLDQYFLKIEDVNILAPIPRPRKNIFCVGKNYREHAIEMGGEADIPSYPMLFSKLPTSVIGPEQNIMSNSHVTQALDYEGELAVVIGKEGKDIPKEKAMDFIFGYTIINDVTARDRQKKHKQFLLGKSLDTFCPMGPSLVHKDEIENPHQLSIETRVNGEVRQKSNTKYLIFDIPTLISVISEGTTLEVGDIIATGTPAGVGSGFKPPKYLNSGDVIEIEIEDIGILRNNVI